ncbi:hypothetical protein L211DRAFT_888218 [Terfezia boudieri ATCC MYA-4762]|uniref:Uncharacterized protein n=1 Tax=Terfezia boudieri ATCC MYA-4762 TaxID=1051890 RepID=A0A3N4M447_9PEZI|nr:hypothetical protein L211DRAFT_888218 [Terfezia boudieri ATCC MYA-4762]
MADIEKKPPTPAPDAGLRNLDHYKYRLPKYRYILRQKFLPLMRWETPYLAWFQVYLSRLQSYFRNIITESSIPVQNSRTYHRTSCSSLDTSFAMTANLGRPTFFDGEASWVHYRSCFGLELDVRINPLGRVSEVARLGPKP